MVKEMDIKKYLIENKERLLKFHKDFYSTIDKIKSYEDISQRIINEAETFIKDEVKGIKSIDVNKLITFFILEKMMSDFNPFS